MDMINRGRAERLIAKRYEEQGYVVTLKPPSSVFPFALGNYQPEILASRQDDNLIIDVKSAGAKTDPEAYFRMDQEVQRHPGWRFLLVTIPEADCQEPACSGTGDINMEKIRENLQNIDRVAKNPTLAELVLPRLWTVYLAALRLLAVHEGVEIKSYPDFNFLNKAYSTGLLSLDEYESARRLMNLRNHAVCSLDPLATPADWPQLRHMVDTALERLAASSVPSTAR